MPTLNPFQSQALLPTKIHLQGTLSTIKAMEEEDIVISFNQPIMATEITTADAILLPPRMRGCVIPDSIETVKDTIQQLPLMDEIKNSEYIDPEHFATPDMNITDQTAQHNIQDMNNPIQILEHEENTEYDPDQNLFEVIPDSYQELAKLIPLSINNSIIN